MLTAVYASEVLSDTCILEWLNRRGVGHEDLEGMQVVCFIYCSKLLVH